MLVVGVWSSMLKDSNFLIALVASLLPLTAKVLAMHLELAVAGDGDRQATRSSRSRSAVASEA